MENKGFTLIEIIVTLTIIAVISAVCIPSISYMHELCLKSDANNLVADIRYTKTLTVINGYEHKITFDNNGYKIVNDTNAIIKSHSFSSSVIFEDNELSRGSSKVKYMSYNIDGTPQESGSIILANTNGKNKIKISIVPITGRVKIVGL